MIVKYRLIFIFLFQVLMGTNPISAQVALIVVNTWEITLHEACQLSLFSFSVLYLVLLNQYNQVVQLIKSSTILLCFMSSLRTQCFEEGTLHHVLNWKNFVFQYYQKNTRSQDVNRRLKSQIWSSVVTIVLIKGTNLISMDSDGYSDPYVKFRWV